MSRYKTVNVDVDVDMSEFDDDDIKDEYEHRFGEAMLDMNWEQLFYIRRDRPLEEFLSVIDKIIKDNSGRVM